MEENSDDRAASITTAQQQSASQLSKTPGSTPATHAPDPLKTKLVAEKGNHALRTKQRHACCLKAVQRRAFRVTTGEFLKNYLYIMKGSIKPLPCKSLVCSGCIPFQPSCSSVGEFMQAHTSLLFVFLLSKIWSRGHT